MAVGCILIVHILPARVLNIQQKYADEAGVWKELSLRVDSEYRRVAYIRCGEAWLNASEPDKALVVLKKYLEDFPEGKEAFLVKNRIVDILLLDQRYDDAVNFLEQMLAGKLVDSEKIYLTQLWEEFSIIKVSLKMQLILWKFVLRARSLMKNEI